MISYSFNLIHFSPSAGSYPFIFINTILPDRVPITTNFPLQASTPLQSGGLHNNNLKGLPSPIPVTKSQPLVRIIKILPSSIKDHPSNPSTLRTSFPVVASQILTIRSEPPDT